MSLLENKEENIWGSTFLISLFWYNNKFFKGKFSMHRSSRTIYEEQSKSKHTNQFNCLTKPLCTKSRTPKNTNFVIFKILTNIRDQ